MGYILGALLGKILSIAGIGSLLAGLFVNKQKYLIMFIILLIKPDGLFGTEEVERV